MKKQKSGNELFGPVARTFFNVNTSGWRSARPVFDISRCTQCNNCIQLCPANIIRFSYASGKNPGQQRENCKNCGICEELFLNDICILYCPTNTIEFGGISNESVKIQMEYCKGCGICAEVCPTGCISMEKEDICEYKK